MDEQHTFTSFMRRAVALAEQGRFRVHPNPAVGAVLVRNGEIVAEGWHKEYGSSHAEIVCLQDATAKGIDPKDCSLVVTLEPCNHYGKTPPCTKAICEAGIKHVVVGARDPNPKASGGIEFLQSMGVVVEWGVEEQLCRDVAAEFFTLQSTDRPYMMLKMASTLDGRIATRSGHSQWISCEESRRTVQDLRANVAHCGGVILIGGGTFRADNPHLTVRDIQGVVADTQAQVCIVTSRLPAIAADNYLLQHRPTQTIFFTPPAVAASRTAQSLREIGVRIWSVEPNDDAARLPALTCLLSRLRTELDTSHILCEGGGKLALNLLEQGLVDEFILHLAPLIMGDNTSYPLFDGRSPLQMSEILDMRFTRHIYCGQDIHLTLRPK